MKLIIAEKPLLGKAIADALPGRAEMQNGVIVKGDYTIIWAYGHLLTLKEPEDFDDKYKSWSIEDLPIFFEPWGLKVGKDENLKKGQQSKAQRVKQIGDLLKKADQVIHAGDIDEEGQLLIDELLRWFHYKGPVQRLDTSDTSTAALRKAFGRLKDNQDCEADGWSAFGRELSDAIFGFNLTRYFSVKNNGTLLPVGRVQTPTLGLVVQRDRLIEKHVKTYYYELFAQLDINNTSVIAKFVSDPENPALTDGKFLSRDYLIQLENTLRGKNLPLIRIKKELQKEFPPLPFNLTKLTTYCSKRWGYNPDDVMKITQSLRENHKAITYNRSDCQYLSSEHFKEAPVTIAAACKNLGIDNSLFDPSIKSRCFNDANITAHFAIIPTAEAVSTDKMTERERNVYTAISNFYLAQFMSPAEKEKTTLEADLGNGEFLKASNSIYLKYGYRTFLHKDMIEEKDQSGDQNDAPGLSDLRAGDYSGFVSSTEIKEKETHAPTRYTQATLAEDMTRIAKYIDDPYVKELLLAKDKDKKGENGSIGTSATRPDIIKGLIFRGYLAERKEGKRIVLFSTPKGRDFYDMLPDEVKKADTTARWWSIQEDIKTGQATPGSMAKAVLETVQSVIYSGTGEMRNAENYAGGSTGFVLGTCPQCGGNILETQSAFSCSNKDCKCVFFKNNKLLASIGKKMSAGIVKTLIAKGQAPLKNCKSEKTGRSFDCILKVEYGSSYPELKIEFQDGLGDEKACCPKCGGTVSKNKFGNYSCDNWKSGCKFTIFGTIAGKKLTDKNVRDLLIKGSTSELHGFTSSKTGAKFDAKLILKPDYSVGFQFIQHRKKW